MLFRSGGKIKEVANLSIVIPSNDTARIQEVHITIGHIICELIEVDHQIIPKLFLGYVLSTGI